MNQSITFTPRTYGCTELALLYCPNATPHGAWITLRRWIQRVPGLRDTLSALGYSRGDRRFTPKMVRAIVDMTGEP